LAAAIEAVTIRTVNSATAAAAWADSISGALGVLNGAADSTFGVVDAQEAFFAAVNDTDKAVGGAAKSTGDYERKQRALEDATRSVEDATDALREAEIARFLVALGPSSDEVVRARIAETRAVREAGDSYFNYQRAVRAAARALEEATPQASKDRRTRAELSVSSAQRAVTESAIATREAEDRLRRARNLGEATADEIKQAELDLAAAKDREVLSSIDLRDAQRDLNDVGRENLDIQDDATDAINAATAAQEAGHLASLDAADAQRALNELLNEGKEGSESLAEANKAVEEAQRAVEAATLAQRDATQALIEKNDALGGSVARTRDRFNEVRDRGTAWIAELQRSGAPIDDVRAAAALLEAELRKIGDSVSPEKRALIDPFFKEISDSIKRYAIEKLLRDNPFLNQAPQPGFKTPGVRHGGGVEGIDPPGSFGSRSLRSDEVVRVLQDGEMTLTRGQQQVFAGLLARASVSSGPSITVQILGPVTNVEDARRGAYDGALAASDVIANRQLAASMRGAV